MRETKEMTSSTCGVALHRTGSGGVEARVFGQDKDAFGKIEMQFHAMRNRRQPIERPLENFDVIVMVATQRRIHFTG